MLRALLAEAAPSPSSTATTSPRSSHPAARSRTASSAAASPPARSGPTSTWSWSARCSSARSWRGWDPEPPQALTPKRPAGGSPISSSTASGPAEPPPAREFKDQTRPPDAVALIQRGRETRSEVAPAAASRTVPPPSPPRRRLAPRRASAWRTGRSAAVPDHRPGSGSGELVARVEQPGQPDPQRRHGLRPVPPPSCSRMTEPVRVSDTMVRTIARTPGRDQWRGSTDQASGVSPACAQ